MTDGRPVIAIAGGTGALGSGLAHRWSQKGFKVVIGSRTADKAKSAAAGYSTSGMGGQVTGEDNKTAASQGDVVVMTVPFSNHEAILTELKDVVAGKIFVDATVPLVPPKVGTVQLPSQGAIALLTQEILGSETHVVSAFQNVAADKLLNQGNIEADVLVCGNKKAARETVIGLIDAIGMRGLHAGPLANSAATEALTSVLITINRHYKISNAGIRITGDLVKDVRNDG
jgi:8-hydroxy-5-deazaflavin:NADPH oxidoreductase